SRNSTWVNSRNGGFMRMDRGNQTRRSCRRFARVFQPSSPSPICPESEKLRLAATPIGPWGEPSLIYECPEQSWPEKVFCYSAKAHPELAGAADELIVTYAANSWEFANVMRDARLYWPRFVRVKLDALKQRE